MSILFLADATYEPFISLGQILTVILVACGTLASLIYGVRYKVGYEAASAAGDELRKSLEDSHAREAELQEGLKAQSEVNSQLRETVRELESYPNLTELMKVMNESDASAQARAEALAKIQENQLSILAKIEEVNTNNTDTQRQILAAMKEMTKALKGMNGEHKERV